LRAAGESNPQLIKVEDGECNERRELPKAYPQARNGMGQLEPSKVKGKLEYNEDVKEEIPTEGGGGKKRQRLKSKAAVIPRLGVARGP